MSEINLASGPGIAEALYYTADLLQKDNRKSTLPSPQSFRVNPYTFSIGLPGEVEVFREAYRARLLEHHAVNQEIWTEEQDPLNGEGCAYELNGTKFSFKSRADFPDRRQTKEELHGIGELVDILENQNLTTIKGLVIGCLGARGVRTEINVHEAQFLRYATVLTSAEPTRLDAFAFVEIPVRYGSLVLSSAGLKPPGKSSGAAHKLL
jgi:hypothetical protein